MDLSLYFRVIWRFRYLVLTGLVVAAGLTFVAIVRVSSRGISYRQHETWASSTTLLVTQTGFPEGYTSYPYKAVAIPGSTQPQYVSPFADPSRFSDLAVYYASLADGDAVQSLLRARGHLAGSMNATPVQLGASSRPTQLPMLTITGTSSKPAQAEAIAARGSQALIDYLTSQQAAAHVPAQDRVIVRVLNAATTATLVQGRKKTIPIVVFVTVLIATLGLAFILENLRPRVRPVEPVEQASEAPPAGARSA